MLTRLQTLSIREATTADANAIAHVEIQTWQTAYQGFLSKQQIDHFNLSDETALLFQLLQDTQSVCHVAELNHSMIGFSLSSPCHDFDKTQNQTGEIKAMYVLPDYWFQGYGSTLIYTALSSLRKRGFREVVLWTLKNNEGAQQFYQKHRFLADGMSKLHAQHAMPAIRLSRVLLTNH